MEKQCSIIIPVYNAEKTIERCLGSILEGERDKFYYEVIVVNDGSIDLTSHILQRYLTIPHIKVVEKKNGGVSSARNTGVKHAVGKYIFFVDADDVLQMDALEEMVACAEKFNLDCLIADYYEGMPQQEVIKSCSIPYDICFAHNDVAKYIFRNVLMGDNTGLSTLCNKIFKREIIAQYDLRFDEARTHGEDWAFCLEYYEAMQSFMHTKLKVYNYILDGSQMLKKYQKNIEYCLVDGHKRAERLNSKYGLLNSEEYIQFRGRFLSQIVNYLLTDEIQCSRKKKFLANDTVHGNILFCIKLSSVQLGMLGYSRRDLGWMLCFYLKWNRAGICILQRWR